MTKRFRSFRSEAVVLYYQEWGEADRIVTIFTRQGGKVRAVAKGVRKIKSRKAGHLEPFTHVMLQLATGKNMPIITQVETLHAYLPLREDLKMMGYGSYVVELVDKFTYLDEENVPIFNLLQRTMGRLANLEGNPDIRLTLRYFESRLLEFSGFRPEMFYCTVCGEEIQAEDQYFSAALGGVVCPKCYRGQEGLRPVSREALRYLRHFQRSTYAQAMVAKPPEAIHREMDVLMGHFLTYTLERGLNSPQFIRRIEGMGGKE